MNERAGAPGIERRRMALLTRVPLRGNQRSESDGRARTDDPRLTARQRQVLDGLIRGLTNKEIAGELGIGPDAVKRVVSRLLIKLNASSRTALVQPALQSDAARRRRSHAPNAFSLLDAVPVPALITRGVSHRLEYANPSAKLVLPEVDSVVELAQLFGPAPRRTIARIADESFSTDTPRVARRVTLDEVRAGTAWRRVDAFTTPMHDGAGKLAGLIVFLVDVSNDPLPVREAAGSSASPTRERERPA